MIVVTEANQAAGQFSASTHAAHALVGQQPKRLAAFFRDHVELLLGSWG
jgi:hypothetical protein